MILILAKHAAKRTATGIVHALQQAYPLAGNPVVVPAGAVWDRTPEWDDLLIVVYDSSRVPKWIPNFISAFRNAHPAQDPVTGHRRPGGFVLPVATNCNHVRPPDPISGIKAVLYDGSAKAKARMVLAAGVLLGMSVRPGRQQIFVSYRNVDGRVIAHDLHHRLEAAGFNAWLDEARENLSPGDDVQDVIRSHVAQASMLLLVDSPQAPSSRWIKEEIDTAIGQLIPVLPVVVGPTDISRFIALASLRRRVPVKPGGVVAKALSNAEWNSVRGEIEQLLAATYRRRLQTISRAERAFMTNGFDWSTVDEGKRMYWSKRGQTALPATIVLSHCSIHDPTYLPALKVYKAFIGGFAHISQVNHKVCVYDDEVLSDVEIEGIGQELQGLPFILVHHAELGVLILSNFARLR